MRGPRKTAGKIFISYRRADTRGEAGRLADTLEQYFGKDRIFRDIESIAGGQDFGDAIQNTLANADAIIVLIGPDWLTSKDEKGGLRLNDPEDWIAEEIAAALELKKLVVPVLVENGQMPRADELPERLRPLSTRNALSLSDNRWHTDVNRLAKILALDMPSETERKLFWLKIGVVLCLSIPLMVTVGFLTMKACPGFDCPDSTLLEFWHSTLPFFGIAVSALLLLGYSKLVDPSHLGFYNASIISGVLGSLVSFLLSIYDELKFLPGSWSVSATVSSYFMATLTIILMYSFLVLSGIKPK